MSPFPRSALRELSRYAPDRSPVAVDLSDNTNRWGAHPAALRALREADPEDLSRYPSVYADDLREAVAARFGVPAETVVTGCGSDDLLDAAFRAGSDPGQGIAFLPPTFAMVEVFARVNGLRLLPVPREPRLTRDAAGGASHPPLPDPERLLEEGPGLVYLCRPNNPTGEVPPASWIRRLLEAAGPAGPVVVLDEAYAEFLDSGEDGGPDGFLREAAASPRLLVLRTFSKAYGLAGLRVGFGVGGPEVVREVEKARGPYKVTRVSERAAVVAVQDREAWVGPTAAAARRAREALRGELEARGILVLPSGANFLCLPLEGSPLEGGAPAVAAALRRAGVAVRPFPDLAGIGETVRVSVGPPEEMGRLLAALDGMLR